MKKEHALISNGCYHSIGFYLNDLSKLSKTHVKV